SIAAARLWPEAAGLAVDNDPEATDCSRENFARNDVTTVSLVTGTLADTRGTFELILANIQADVLCELASAMAEHVSVGGHV
ncbi:50S ribosomal protein L11 methyltransferase, partial [Klebsiella pneumoniae]|nr:50S ribosomal protein L11 methyltransferase [Klebsiella pneumoniae]